MRREDDQAGEHKIQENTRSINGDASTNATPRQSARP